MRGLFIGIHKSCSFLPNPFEYNYIISANIISFWGISCSIDNIYISTSSHKDAHKNALYDAKNWLLSHHNSSKPALLMGDFNMSKQDISQFLSKYNLSWNILDLTRHQLTWSRGGHTSCIDHILANDKIMEFINQSSACTSFNDLSDHFPIILSCRKIDNEGFVSSSPSKSIRWFNRICIDKSKDIFSHNFFSVLANDFVYSNNNSASTMASKFLDTADKIGDDIDARIPSNLKGSPFHCPHYIKKLFHVKHTLYKNVKEFSLDINNLDEFHTLNKEYSVFM